MVKEEKQNRDVVIVYTNIVKRLIDNSWKFPQGGLAIKCLNNFVLNFTKQCGGVLTNDRLVDYCVYQAYRLRDFDLRLWKPAHSFGNKAMSGYNESKHGVTYYEDKWMSTNQLTRSYLCGLINKKEHPQSKYIYMPSEETTKKRFINNEVGFFLCQTSTLGWSPMSPSCQMCEQTEQCKAETSRKFPELYRIRIEYEQGN